MANSKATKAGTYEHQNDDPLLHKERRRLKSMQIIFAIFCTVLILSMLLSLITNS